MSSINEINKFLEVQKNISEITATFEKKMNVLMEQPGGKEMAERITQMVAAGDEKGLNDLIKELNDTNNRT